MLRFAVSLTITILTELPISRLFRARGKDLLLVLLVNILTNPGAVLASMLLGDSIFVQFVLEVVVICIEGYYYRKYSTYIKRTFCCSLCCNLVSYSIGVIL